MGGAGGVVEVDDMRRNASKMEAEIEQRSDASLGAGAGAAGREELGTGRWGLGGEARGELRWERVATLFERESDSAARVQTLT